VIAASFNKYLGQKVFSASDFIPRDSDYPEGRDVTKDPALRAFCKSIGEDIEKLCPPGERHQFLTLTEFIEVYKRGAQKALPYIVAAKAAAKN
jgi:hypothetical protein